MAGPQNPLIRTILAGRPTVTTVASATRPTPPTTEKCGTRQERLVVSPGLPKKYKPSVARLAFLRVNLERSVAGKHLFFVSKREQNRRIAALAIKPKGAAPVATSRKPERGPRITINKKKVLLRVAIYLWSTGDLDVFEKPSSLRNSCGVHGCLEPEHQTRTRS